MDASLALPSIARTFGLDAVYAFGSRAREVHEFVTRRTGLAASRSDVDIGVLPQAGNRLDARQRVDLTLALERFLANSRVDLLILPEAPPMLAVDIVSGELLFAGDRTREAEYQLYVLRRAADLARFERERRAIILAGGR
jgi:uncharacterized protein